MALKKISVLIFSLFIFTGCYSEKIIIDYNQTNPVKIEESIKGLDINEFVKDHANKSQFFAIQSIEEPMIFTGTQSGRTYTHNTNSIDWGTKYLIEDILISSLTNEGYKVLERDPEILESLYAESGDKYAILNFKTVLESNIGSSGQGTSKSIEREPVKNGEFESSRQYQILTELTSADLLLTYRVLECGVVYKAVENDSYKVERIARTRLHCRLENSKTSEIITAGIVGHVLSDVIEKSLIPDYEEIQYKFYYHTLPNMSQEHEQSTQLLQADVSEKSNKNAIWGGTATLIGISLLSLLL